MVGIIDVGGGARGVYSSGVYDCFLDNGFKTDYGIGVSAGAANLITFIAGQRGRTLKFYKDYYSRKEHLSFQNIVKHGRMLNLDYFFSTISNKGGENPLDYASFKKADIPFYAVATRVKDGKAAYFSNESFAQDSYDVLKATCSLPIVCSSVKIEDEYYLDGGLSDPIPIEKAFSDGCDKVILILTKKRQDYFSKVRFSNVIKAMPTKNTAIKKAALTFHEKCKKALLLAQEYEKQGKVIILEPSDCFGIKTLSNNSEAILKMYQSGYNDAEKILKSQLGLFSAEK